MAPQYPGDQTGAMPAAQNADIDLQSFGTRFWVDPVNGVDSAARGRDKSLPVATIGFAHASLVVSGLGDEIVCVPGTYEEAVVITKDFVHLRGAWCGYGKPDLVFDGIALVVRGQGFRMSNFRIAQDAGADTDLARIEGNGGRYEDVVFDGNATMGAAKALLRMWCHVSDDSYTASENRFVNCLFRGGANLGFGLVFDIQHATVGVGPTDNVFENCEWRGSTLESIMVAETALGTYSAQRNRFRGCSFLDRNKATHVDFDAINGATNTENVFEDCFFWDDTIDGTALKGATANVGWIGCRSLDGIFDGDALD